MPRKTPTSCPECGNHTLSKKRDPVRYVLGWLMIVFGVITAFPLLGITVFFVFIGVAWTSKRLHCDECGWRGPSA